MSALDLAGHRADVRSMAFSADDSMLLSTSSNSTKIWNPHTGACLRTVESGYGLSSIWAPGDRHAVVGTKACPSPCPLSASTRVYFNEGTNELFLSCVLKYMKLIVLNGTIACEPSVL